MRKSRKWLLWIGGLLVTLYLVWGIYPYIFGESPIRWTTVTTVTYPGGIEVRTTALHEVLAFIVGPHLFVPFPFHHVEEDYETIVLVNGRERVRFTATNRVNIYPSPSGKYIVTENRSYTEPFHIYHALSDMDLSWDKESIKKELPGDPYMVTFQFVQWEDDNHFIVEVGGRGFPDCRQTWRVDADSGSHELSTSTSRPAIRPWG